MGYYRRGVLFFFPHPPLLLQKLARLPWELKRWKAPGASPSSLPSPASIFLPANLPQCISWIQEGTEDSPNQTLHPAVIFGSSLSGLDLCVGLEAGCAEIHSKSKNREETFAYTGNPQVSKLSCNPAKSVQNAPAPALASPCPGCNRKESGLAESTLIFKGQLLKGWESGGI